jgi:NADPH-dependent 2,4-dienoyl-CoA reductase/sulfur reductase-like enzyme
VSIPGSDLKNVFTLRSVVDANSIDEKINEESHVVILGVSFIGMEAASYAVKKASKVTVVGRDEFPLRAFGNEVGEQIMKFFEDQDVEFVMKNGIKECIGNSDGEITEVLLNDGNKLKADVLIMGVGTTFNTAFLKDSGIAINPNGSINTNEFLETNVDDVFVGGDIANSPILMTGQRETIGHYGLAQYHGKIAATNMCGTKKELQVVPFFWTMLFGKSIRYAGHGRPHEVKIEGDLEDMKFVVFYFDRDGKVISMASCGRDPVLAQFAEYLALGKTLTKADVEREPFGWINEITAQSYDAQ